MAVRSVRVVAMVGLIALVAVSCAGDGGDVDAHVSGVVTEVTGDLTLVKSFVVLDSDGESHLFTPEPDLLFLGGPLSHLRDHVVTGQRVTVSFEEANDGRRIAVLIEHEVDDDAHDH